MKSSSKKRPIFFRLCFDASTGTSTGTRRQDSEKNCDDKKKHSYFPPLYLIILSLSLSLLSLLSLEL